MSRLNPALLAQSARVSAVEMCARARAAHIGSSLSVVDILSTLYSGAANVDPETLKDPNRDCVIVSKGHAAAGVYAVLAHAGFFPLEWLDSYCADGGLLGGHVTSGYIPGVEFSTGSLGHGLPVGAGVALGRRRSGLPGRVFVVISDGECDEGTTWEAALLASHHSLSNLTVLIDRNGIQSLDATEETLRLEPLGAKWSTFGWHVSEVDGHDHAAMGEALLQTAHQTQPTLIICRTLKGKGVSFMENSVTWHYRSPAEDSLAAALTELQGRNL